LIYYEDFHDDDGGHEHFLTATRPPGRDDPLQSLIDGGFREAVVDSIKALPEREQLLMALYYEQEMNLKEIGAVMGVRIPGVPAAQPGDLAHALLSARTFMERWPDDACAQGAFSAQQRQSPNAGFLLFATQQARREPYTTPRRRPEDLMLFWPSGP
jgi:hypothetical protein